MRKILAIIIILTLALVARIIIYKFRNAMMNKEKMNENERISRKKLNQ